MGATLKSRTVIGLLCILAAMCFAQTANADSLPAPTILNGPGEGSTINSDSASFVFDYPNSLTGGSLLGYLCSLDGAPAAACNANHDLLGLSPGVHTLGVSASILPAGGVPVCVLTVCATLPPVAVETDALTRTFTVDLGGSTGSTTNNNSSNTTTTGSDKLGAFALAWGKYKRQQSKCKSIKRRAKSYKSHANRVRATKRFKKCIKTQKKLRAEAMALAR